jgi:hypothetical protein
MEHQTGWLESLTRTVRWIGRIWSIGSIGLVLAFIVGEGIEINEFKPSAEWLGFLFFPVGVCVGMIVAWRKERWGGSITVASLAIFYLIHFATSGAFPSGWAWLAFAGPGFVFLWLGLNCARRRSN